jgi:hypothetical protein
MTDVFPFPLSSTMYAIPVEHAVGCFGLLATMQTANVLFTGALDCYWQDVGLAVVLECESEFPCFHLGSTQASWSPKAQQVVCAPLGNILQVARHGQLWFME